MLLQVISMAHLLGPLPETMRPFVSQLVNEARKGQAAIDPRIDGFLLAGGPGGCSFLDADGEAWFWSVADESITHIEDGPRKVSLICLAAERVRGLAQWLPSRPPLACNCPKCNASGWINVQSVRLQCPNCSGIGWLFEE